MSAETRRLVWAGVKVLLLMAATLAICLYAARWTL